MDVEVELITKIVTDRVTPEDFYKVTDRIYAMAVVLGKNHRKALGSFGWTYWRENKADGQILRVNLSNGPKQITLNTKIVNGQESDPSDPWYRVVI